MKLLQSLWLFLRVLGTPFVEMYRGIKVEYQQIEQAKAERMQTREAHFRMLHNDSAQHRRPMRMIFVDAAKETPRLYFAPLTGAVKGLRHAVFGRK